MPPDMMSDTRPMLRDVPPRALLGMRSVFAFHASPHPEEAQSAVSKPHPEESQSAVSKPHPEEAQSAVSKPHPEEAQSAVSKDVRIAQTLRCVTSFS